MPALVFAVAGIVGAAVVIAAKTPAFREPVPRASFHAGSGTRAAAPFDLDRLTIAREALRSGGPPKDGIPALTDPSAVGAGEATFLLDDDEIIGIVFGGEARAYPLAILDYHEIINDAVGGREVAVTYCPLCDSSVVVDRAAGEGTAREFGVSGKLYNSNVLMFDRRTEGVESLWTQMGSIGVSGPGADKRLNRLPMEVTTWGSWRERHPQTTVLSDQTGHRRAYNRSVYANYFASEQLMFAVEPLDDRLPAKTPILGVASSGGARAYTNPSGIGASVRRERLGDAEYDLIIDGVSGRLRIDNVVGDIEWCYAFWFAWAAFNPETEVVDRAGP